MLHSDQTVAALLDLGGRPRYLHSGWFLISVGNLVVIVVMVVVFAVALLVPYRRHGDES